MSASLTELNGAIEALVHEVESLTSAEIVVVLAGTSDHYQRVSGWVTAGAAVVSAGFFCWSPWVFPDVWIPVDIAVIAGLAGALATTNLGLRTWLIGAKRREAAVSLAADAAFWQEAVHATRGRTGVLLYVSVAEHVVAVRADTAILTAVPAGEWTRAVAGLQLSSLSTFSTGLREMGKVLGQHLPRAADDVNESPDAPRVRA